MKVLLIQIRTKEDILAEEASSFLEACGVASEELAIVNPIKARLKTESLNEIDSVIIGGSGAFSVTKDYDWTKNLEWYLSQIFDKQIPCFGSCWGHQFIARVLGGTVVHDLEKSEMGTHEVQLTEEGKKDPLMSTLPSRFKAQMGHQDRVSILPPTCIELAESEVAPNQAFRHKDLPIYGTQFHPELSAANERKRLDAYRDAYPEMADSNVFEKVYDSVCETPEVSSLLSDFLRLVRSSSSL